MTRLPFLLCALITLTPLLTFAADEDDPKKLDPAHMKALAEAIGAKPGETRGRVHTLSLPREDLDVYTMDTGDVPTEAGLATTLRLWRCGCGKYYVVGEFCVVDYESNDVIDALRGSGGHVSIVSVSPILLQEKPRILMIRLQGEGDIDTLTKSFKEAVRWIGGNRSKREPIK
jgi:hypothetical protein